jgi:glutamate N-acetyltransferase/amino-acid N-acetyltransferase
MNLSFLPLGFKACGIAAHIKKSAKLDLALFYSRQPCVTSGMFTTNRVKAAPVQECWKVLKARKRVRALIVNSGNANCMTGAQGLRDARRMAALVARELACDSSEVLVSSTGIIGKLMPMARIEASVGPLAAALSHRGLEDAARAMMTTDTFEKIVTRKVKIDGKNVIFSGVTKGAGMIAPNMRHATMLAYVFTDARITKRALDKALGECAEVSFNAITIDGCMSTNDTLLAMANGAAQNKTIDLSSQGFEVFKATLKDMCVALAGMIVADAEGATKFIKINVQGARQSAEAKRLAMSVAQSLLFKCAMFGNNPNWGRIAAALGAVASNLDWRKMDILLNNRFVFKAGQPRDPKDRNFLKKKKQVDVVIDLHQGKARGSVLTSDLSYAYVRINAEYN